MNRREARTLAMQYIFQMEAQKDFNPDGFEVLAEERELGNQEDYIKDIVKAVCSHLESIDGCIDANSKGWPVSRMAKADLAILRLAAAEILYIDELPKSVSINEAVELAKVYGDEKSSGFINAVLKNIE